MVSVGNNILKHNETYHELIDTLCQACSYDLNSQGIKLLEEAASAISLAVNKLNELEQFIANSKFENINKVNSAKEIRSNQINSTRAECEDNEILVKEVNKCPTIYFSVNENIAENHIIEAFEKAGITNFVLDKLVNRINFAYGFISFTDEKSFESMTSSSNNIYIGNSLLRIIPKTGVSFVENENTKKSRKRKRGKGCQNNP